jgi:hypothetical protein
VGAEPRGLSRRALLALALGAALSATGALPAAAQVPDTVRVVPDTARPVLADTLARLDTIPAADTIPADTLPPRDLPRFRVGAPSGWATMVWSWDRDDFMGMRDLTLLELLEEVPGVVPIRGGDYGAPEAASALGMAAGRVRVFLDGFEQLPLDGGAPDLSMIGLGGVEELRVERGPGELRIYVESLVGRDPRPLSMVEAGTGDTDTNFFRGTFMHPRILGGIFGFAMERVDTRGPFSREPGHRAGAWASWTRPIGESFGVRAEARRMERDVDLNASPIGLERTDWMLRARGRLRGELVTAELFTGGSLLESESFEVPPIVPVERSLRQHGARVEVNPGPAWLAGTLRIHDRTELPYRSIELEGGGTLPGIGGAFARWSTDSWTGRDVSAFTAHAWTVPVAGLSAFASVGKGLRGYAIFPPYDSIPASLPDTAPLPEPADPGLGFTDMTTLRVGGSWSWRSLALEGAWLSMEADVLPPMGLVLDRGGPPVPGGTFRGFEGRVRLPLPVEGFTLSGSVQSWDEEARYLPKRVYQGAIDFHDVFLETRNLELWGALGVKGRDPMLVPQRQVSETPQLQRVPFYQNWYLDIQVRVLPVHIFIRWENFTLRENLRDLPDRTLPVTRAIYGVKWILWN